MPRINSIRKNFIANFIRVLLNMLFPLITFPYASRILFAEGIGKVSFAQGLVAIFVLISSLGLPIYGIRAVAKVRDNKEKLTSLVKELLVINLISTIIVLGIFYLIIYFNPSLFSQKELFVVLSLSIILTNLGVEWFYQGVEEYNYITKVSVFFKIVSLILLFILVRSEKDYVSYSFVLVLSVYGSGFVNFVNLRKHINIKQKNKLNLKKHLKPVFLIFGFNIATSIYINLDTVILGYFSGDREVGLYTASLKITKIIVVLVTTLGGVLVPRLSYYIENGEIEEFKRITRLSANFIVLVGLPCIIGLFFLAPEAIYIFGGEDFLNGYVAMRIMLPIILFIGFSNFIGLQIMYPSGYENRVLTSVVIGAIVNITLNMLLIPHYQHIGAAISTVSAEGVVLLVQIILAKKIINFTLFDNNLIKYIISACFMLAFLALFPFSNLNVYLSVSLRISLGALIYFVILIILKEELVRMIIRKAR